MEGYTGRGVKTGGIIGAALLALILAGPTGCVTARAVGDAVDKIVTGDEDAVTKAKRALAGAYATHRAATRGVRSAYLSGDMGRDDAIKAADILGKALTALDYSRSLVALGDVTSGLDELSRAEALIGSILIALPKESK